MSEQIESKKRSINFKLISDNKRSEIMKYLIESEEGRSFKQISLETGISPTSLAYHLKVLKDAGMIGKEFRNEVGRRDYTRYMISEEGENAFRFSDIYGEMEGTRGDDVPDRLIVLPMQIYPRSIRLVD